jgi:hypothetical protein
VTSELITELEERIADLNRRWPAYSPPPSMLEQLEELEAQLQEELKKLAEEQGEDNTTSHGES